MFGRVFAGSDLTLGFLCQFGSATKEKAGRRISGTASRLGGINLSRQGDTLTNTDPSIQRRDFYELPHSHTFFFFGIAFESLPSGCRCHYPAYQNNTTIKSIEPQRD